MISMIRPLWFIISDIGWILKDNSDESVYRCQWVGVHYYHYFIMEYKLILRFIEAQLEKPTYIKINAHKQKLFLSLS